MSMNTNVKMKMKTRDLTGRCTCDRIETSPFSMELRIDSTLDFG